MAPAEGPVESPADSGGTIVVEVVYCPAPHQIDLRPLRLRVPVSARQAVQASGLVERHGLDAQALRLGVWGKVCDGDLLLRERDRVEVYRPLSVDPKEARRLRYKGARAKRQARG